MAIGRTGSFATVQPNQNNPIGDALAYTEQQARLYRAEDEVKKDKAKLAKAEFDKNKDEYKNFNYTLSGNQSIDDIGNSFATDTFNRYNEAVKEINNPSTPDERRQQLKIANSKRVQNFDVLKQIPELLKASAKDLEEGVKNAKYNERDIDLIKRTLQKIESGQAKVYTDEYGNMLYDIPEMEVKGKPIAELITTMKPHLAPKFGSLLSNFRENTLLSENAWQTGADKYEQKLIDDKALKSVDAFATMIASDPSERYDIAQILGVDENDPKVRQYAYDKAMSALAEKRKHDIDAGILNYGLAVKKNNQEQAEKAISIANPSEIKIEGEKDGVKIQKGSKSFPLGNVIIKGTGGKEQKATNVYVAPGGKMYLRVEESGFDSGSKKVTRYTEKGLKKKAEAEKAKKPFVADFDDIEDVTISDKSNNVKMLDFGKDQNEIGRYAIRMGYNSADELAKDFIARSGGDKFFKAKKETTTSAKPKIDY